MSVAKGIRPALDPREILQLLHDGRFQDLIGLPETHEVEFKAEPYRLQESTGKLEFAKDISALANALGGIIVLGVRTEKHIESPVDVASDLRPIPRELVDEQRLKNVLANLVYPSVRGFEVLIYPSPDDPARVLCALRISEQTEKPYLVGMVVLEDGQVSGKALSLFQRSGPSVSATSLQQLQRYLQDGMRFETLLSEHLSEIRGLLVDAGRVAPEETGKLQERLEGLVSATKLKGSPIFFLIASPAQAVEMNGLFESRYAEAVRWLENPSRLRQAGFDITTDKPSRIVEGRSRRSVVEGWKGYELWQDGVLLFVARGDDQFLCWGSRENNETLWINQLALVECTYLFVVQASNLLGLAIPTPGTVRYLIGLEGFSEDRRRLVLTPGPLKAMGAGTRAFEWHEAEVRGETAFAPADAIVRELVTLGGEPPELIALRLLAEFYGWFGFEMDRIPYTKLKDGRMVVDDGALRMG